MRKAFISVCLIWMLSFWTGPALIAQKSGAGQGDTIQSLIKQLAAPYQEDRKNAALELERIGAPAEPQLIIALSEEDYRIKVGSIKLLLKLHSQKAVAPIGRLFESDPDDVVRIEAFRFLREVPGLSSESYMIKALDIEDADIRMDAVKYLTLYRVEKALTRVQALYRLKDLPAEIKNGCFEYFLNLGKPSGEILLGELKNADDPKKLKIIEALGTCTYDTPEAVKDIAALIAGSSTPSVQGEAVEYLAKIGPPAEPHLIKLLKHPKAEFKKKAIEGLGNVKSDAAVESLIGLMGDPSVEIKTAAIDAVLSVGPEVFKRLDLAVQEGRLKESDIASMRTWYEVKEVISRLEQLIVTGDMDFYGFYEGQFKEFKERDADKMRTVLLSIVRGCLIGGADEHIQRWIKRDRGAVVSLCVMALGDIGDASAAKPLKEIYGKSLENTYLFKEDLKLDFTTTLYRLGDRALFQETIAALEKAEGDKTTEQHYTASFRKAVIYNRVGLADKAESVYQDLVGRMEKEVGERAKDLNAYRTALYNLACLYSKKKKAKESLAVLRKAVDSGFSGKVHLKWIERDADLNSIRNEDGYKGLLKELKDKLGAQ